ncbi:MAG: type II secretion system protein [Planctomycetota bacterium]
MPTSEPTTRAMPKRRGASARGLTLIEAVLASVILGLLATTLMGAISSISAADLRQQQRLAAAELASRLMIMYLDDAESMPSNFLPVAYKTWDGLSPREQWRYRWDVNERFGVELEPSISAAQEVPSLPDAFDGFAGRAKLVTVRVWLSEESGGSFLYDQGVPSSIAVRLVDPVDFENADSFQRRFPLESEEGVQRLMRTLMEATGGPGSGGGDSGSGGGGN